MDIPHHRLNNQQIDSHQFDQPGELVSWMGAIQAQDYLGSLWALGLRLPGATEKQVEQAIANRSIVRTWPMRGTLHFVAAADVRWMLELLAARVISGNAARLKREYELDEPDFARSREAITQALQGGKQLTRNTIYQVLEADNISTANQRGLQILWRLAQEGLICLGTREGKQPTYVLLDEWVRNARLMERDPGLAELARRYFTSHGPATVQDFSWWSGLAAREAQAGLDLARQHLNYEKYDGQTYWFSPQTPGRLDASSKAYLLPAYDEYTVAYKNRSAILDPKYKYQLDPRSGILGPVIVMDGQVVGGWKRTIKKDHVEVELKLFSPEQKTRMQSLNHAIKAYGDFLVLEAVV